MKTYLSKHISSNPEICSGDPVVDGTRLNIDVLAQRLLQGESIEEFEGYYADIPSINIRAAVSEAMLAGHERLMELKHREANPSATKAKALTR